MNDEALRIAVRAPEARECLTAKQRQTLEAFLIEKTVAATARRLACSRPTVMKHLALAGKKLLAFAREIS